MFDPTEIIQSQTVDMLQLKGKVKTSIYYDPFYSKE